jgi:hypothetical protein
MRRFRPGRASQEDDSRRHDDTEPSRRALDRAAPSWRRWIAGPIAGTAPIACRRRPSGDGGRLREVSARVEIPCAAAIELEHLVLDVNGTLTHRGDLISGVAERIAPLRQRLAVHLLSADTRAQLGAVAERIAVPAQAITGGEEKRGFVKRLGADQMLRGWQRSQRRPDAASRTTRDRHRRSRGSQLGGTGAAEVVCASITAALDPLLDPVSLASTLRLSVTASRLR